MRPGYRPIRGTTATIFDATLSGVSILSFTRAPVKDDCIYKVSFPVTYADGRGTITHLSEIPGVPKESTQHYIEVASSNKEVLHRTYESVKAIVKPNADSITPSAAKGLMRVGEPLTKSYVHRTFERYLRQMSLGIPDVELRDITPIMVQKHILANHIDIHKRQ